ncbi:MAG: glycine cleavage system aminomethyltransferase GcvT [Caldilineales bacterium]|nr:glycine cleavage system aminomethyltransferase GcvT [Caldilineales bacterium]
MSELNRTPLYAQHVALGGRMVPFAGYELPVQYPAGPLAEHQAVRTAAGLFDIDHMGQFRVVGPDAEVFLQYVQPRDISQMKVWDAEYSFLCYADGTLIDDIFIYRLPDEWFVVVNAANRAKDLFWLDTHVVGFDCDIIDVSDPTCMLALQGPKAQEILQKLTAIPLAEVTFHTSALGDVAGIETLIGATGYTGEYGYELFFPAEQAVAMWESLLEAGEPEGLLPCGLASRDSLRFEACLPLYGHEMTAELEPIGARLAWVCDWDKGPWLGREAVLKTKLEGASRMLVGLEMVDRGVPREGYAVADGEQQVGWVTTGMKAPSLDRFLALAYVPAHLSRLGTELNIIIRDQPKATKVVKRPFYLPAYRR